MYRNVTLVSKKICLPCLELLDVLNEESNSRINYSNSDFDLLFISVWPKPWFYNTCTFHWTIAEMFLITFFVNWCSLTHHHHHSLGVRFQFSTCWILVEELCFFLSFCSIFGLPHMWLFVSYIFSYIQEMAAVAFQIWMLLISIFTKYKLLLWSYAAFRCV